MIIKYSNQNVSVFLTIMLSTFSFPSSSSSGLASLAYSAMHFEGVINFLCSLTKKYKVSVGLIFIPFFINYSR